MTDEKLKKGRAKNEERMVIKDPYLEPYEIRVDAYNYVVYDTSKSATSAPQAYCNDVPSALKVIVKEKLANDKITITLSEYLQKIVTEREKINQIISKINL